jgi:hypothetical protein
MHFDLTEKAIGRRLRALADEPAAAPCDWAEFRRRCQGAESPRRAGRNRFAVAAGAIAAVVALIAFAIVRSGHPQTMTNAPAGSGAGMSRRPGIALAASPARSQAPAQAGTRSIEGWLAGLPHDPAVVRVGANAAVTSLQDQIASLDDLLSAERAAGAQPNRLRVLERRRAQLVSSLAQLRYAELLASVTP